VRCGVWCAAGVVCGVWGVVHGAWCAVCAVCAAGVVCGVWRSFFPGHLRDRHSATDRQRRLPRCGLKKRGQQMKKARLPGCRYCPPV
jgi:hypothetical protein